MCIAPRRIVATLFAKKGKTGTRIPAFREVTHPSLRVSVPWPTVNGGDRIRDRDSTGGRGRAKNHGTHSTGSHIRSEPAAGMKPRHAARRPAG